MYSGKLVLFGQIWLFSGNNGCIQEKVVVFGQNLLCWGCVVVIKKKWLYSAKVVVMGQKLLYSGKVDVFRKNWLYLGKSGWYSCKNGCIWAELL